MNKYNAKEFLPLVQALADGKALQVLQDGAWQDIDQLVFGGYVDNYRIKPEPPKPREWAIAVATKENSTAATGYAVLAISSMPCRGWEFVKVREIIKENEP